MSCTRKAFVLLPVAFVGFMLASTLRASAASESCPASIEFWPGSQSTNGASTYNYDLSALTDRTVDATIIADTNDGWFAWSVRGVSVQQKRYLVKSGPLHYTHRIAMSPTLAVEVPAGTIIKHAWVTSASTQGETVFGWDRRGTVPCELPDVSKQGIKPNAVEIRGSNDVAPAPAPAAVVAAPAAAPFAPSDCKEPFSPAKVSDVMQAEYPPSLIGIVTGPEATAVYVAIDDKGTVADTWIAASSGYAAMDDAALRAARQSGYAPATAYCRHVGGVYIVLEEFR